MPTESRHRRGGCVTALLLAMLVVAGCGRGDGATPPRPTLRDARSVDAAVAGTETGMVRGVVAPDHRFFAGIPYAAPPVGPLRWRPPQPPAPWPGLRDASRPGPWCVQGSGGASELRVSEDCLTLNVWTPPAGTADKRPVMVWIHGGGFVNGSADIYNARWLAAQGDVVVVTINYRLGALGFLAHPALGEVGNYGLADQQAALRWVHDNIDSFGGDPTKVTVAGESAGGMSVCDHLVAPESAGLFRAAIIQSGPCQAQVNVATAQRISRDYAASVGCGDPVAAARCLRELPVDKLTEPLWYARFGSDYLSGPVTGTDLLPVDPVRVFVDGNVVRVPVLIGTNRDEFSMFVALQYLREGREISAARYLDVLADTFGPDHAAAVHARYRPEQYGGSASLAYAAAATDDVFACASDRMVDGLARSAPAIYAYEFDDHRAPAPELYQQVPFPIGASHSLEMRYLFDVGGAPPLDPAQRRLSRQMIAYWAQFMTTGSENVADQPHWPKVGRGSDAKPRMSLRPDGSRVTKSFAAEHQCRFWARVRGSR